MPQDQTVAIVQARMGSTRLPGKVLKDIAGKPMLERVLDRLSLAETLDRIVVATSNLERDDRIETEAKALGFPVTRGPEQDVLDRYRQAAAEHDAGTIARVTSDCPLIDPGIVDQVVHRYRETSADYASNTLPPRTFPRGLDVEVFSREALDTAWDEDQVPHRREHVTPYIRNHPERFEHAKITRSPDVSHHRWTVDEPDDLVLARAIYDELPSPTASWTEILSIVEEKPNIAAINEQVEQKHGPG